MYEVDNRYPEIMPLYSKVSGGKSYGALHGATAMNKAKRTSRINDLKRSFWTTAAAVVAVLALMVSGGDESPAAKSFLEPTLEIVSAEQGSDNLDELYYSYEVELNDAEAVDVTVTARTEDGEILGTAGPYHHETSGVSEQMRMTVSRPVGLSSLKLELTASYYRDGESYQLNAEREVPMREPEPVTEPLTEPATEPSPTTAETVAPSETPTLSILSCELNGSNVSPLRYRYEITLAGAESIEVTAEITDQAGNPLGADGPWFHGGTESSPLRETALEWEERPAELTLTLTGSYTENGETKTLTTSQTLAVPEEPFTAPTLTVTDAMLQSPEGTPLRWRYELQLNSAESLEVSAQITDENGNSLASDGPFLHTASERAPERETALSWTTRPREITLTLTGSYTEDGEARTVTASQTVEMSAVPFTAPTLTISNASLNGTSVTPLSYHYRVRLNSASSLRVQAVISSNTGARLGTDGPYTHSKSETSPTRRAALSWTTRPETVILTLTGSYTQNGVTKTVTASQTLRVSEPAFTAPTLTIANAALNGTDAKQLNYSYRVSLNSAASMQVRASITSNTGAGIGSGGPYTHNSTGTSPTRNAALSWTTRPTTVTLTLTGTYTQNGSTKTVTATQRLTVPEAPFTAPRLNLVSATLNGSNVTPLSYSYRVTLNSATSMQVRATISSNTGAQLGTDGPYTHSSSGNSPTRSAALRWTTRPTTVTLTLTGTYTEKGSTKTVTATQTLNVPAEPFTAPTLAIANAALNGDDATALSYAARVTLNSAANLQIRATVTANGGASLGTDGPFTQSSSGTSATRNVALSWTTRPASVTLTLTGTYTENGTSKTVTATQTLNVPFTAPTLSISDVFLDADDVTPLSYSYQVTLNSAQSMEVSAAISSDLGENLGADGPYSHTASGSSPTRSVDLEWDNWPGTVTLTLTGTYTENGSTKTVTASRTLEVPAEPFTDPTLEIKTATAVQGSSMVVYNYIVTLNDATELQVDAEMSYEEEIEQDDGSFEIVTETLLTGGPFTHTASETSELQKEEIGDLESFPEITLTLTGTYQTKNGETKTITVSKVLEFFDEPEIEVTAAQRDPSDPEKIIYSADILLHDAESLSVNAELSMESTVYGTDGPIEITSSQSITDRVIDAPDSAGHDVTLWLVGTYEIEGESFEVWGFMDVEAAPFTDPELTINSAAHNADGVLYEYELTLNSASEMQITASFYDNAGLLLLTSPAVLRDSSGSFTESETDINISTASRIVLTGEYDRYGSTQTVTASAEIEAPPFTAPSITEFGANVPLFEESADFEVDFYYHLNMGDADQVIITVSVVSSDGLFLGDDGGITQTETDYYDGSVSPDYEEGNASVVVTITGEYKENGVTKTISQSTTVPVVMAPDSFTSDGEVSLGPTDDTLYFGYWAEFLAREQDPHLNAYNFQVKSLTAYWCDNSGAQVGQTEYDSSVLSQFTISRSDNSYLFECNGVIPGPTAGSGGPKVIFRLVVTDVSTGNDYTTDTDILDIQN